MRNNDYPPPYNNLSTRRSEAMRLAAVIRKRSDMKFGESIHTAYMAFQLWAHLYKGSVLFTYEKLNGEIRHAFGTRQDDFYEFTTTVMDYEVLSYYDIDRGGIRGFKPERLKSVTLITNG